MSKAWMCANNYGTIEIVFADTKRRAKSYLKFTDSFEDYRHIDIYPERAKVLDYLDHNDGYIMNWHKDEDKLPMVRDSGFNCRETYREFCEECCAKEWCSKYKKEERKNLESDEM